MSRGFFIMPRHWMNNPAFKDEPFCSAASYAWFMERAVFRAGRHEWKGWSIDLARGELYASYRSLADRWHLAKTNVERRLNDFKDAGLIAVDTSGKRWFRDSNRDSDLGQEKSRLPMVVTVCQYEAIQGSREVEREAGSGQGGGTADGTLKKQGLKKSIPSESRGDLFGHAPQGEIEPQTGVTEYPDVAIKQTVWTLGVGLLTNTGMPNDAARRLIGKWRRDAGDDEELGRILYAAVAARTQDPKSYVTAALQKRQNQRAERESGSRYQRGASPYS